MAINLSSTSSAGIDARSPRAVGAGPHLNRGPEEKDGSERNKCGYAPRGGVKRMQAGTGAGDVPSSSSRSDSDSNANTAIESLP